MILKREARLTDAGQRLSALLGQMSGASSVSEAANAFATAMCEVTGARNAELFVLHWILGELRSVARVVEGSPDSDHGAGARIADPHHPLRRAATDGTILCGTGPVFPVEFESWVAVPVRQMGIGTASHVLPDSTLSSEYYNGNLESAGTLGEQPWLAPFGIIVLEGDFPAEIVRDAARLCDSAGPVLGQVTRVSEILEGDRQIPGLLMRYPGAPTVPIAGVDVMPAAGRNGRDENDGNRRQVPSVLGDSLHEAEFLASMSHELRTPINALMGYTSLMMDGIYGELTARQQEGLGRINEAAESLLTIVNDILDLSAIESGRVPVVTTDVSVNDVLRDIRYLCGPAATGKGLEFNVTSPEPDIILRTDGEKLRQILRNLVSNAVKFTRTGSVSVTGDLKEDAVVFTVADTGVGIREEQISQIWEAFRQLDQSRTREFGGTGLGLAITRRLVELINGEIRVRSDFGEGSVFTILLPVPAVSHPDGLRANVELRTGHSKAS